MHPQFTTLGAATPIPPDIRATLELELPPVASKRLVIPTPGAHLYARMSRPKQANIARQLRLLHDLADRLQLPVLFEESDEKSGLRRDRAGLQRLLVRARARLFSHLLLYKFDRLSRDDEGFLVIVHELFDLGIRIFDCYEGEVTRANAAALAAKAHDEVVAGSQRSTAALADLAENGMKLGAPLLGYVHGDESGTYVEDLEGKKYKKPSGPAVRQVFIRYANDEPLQHIRRWFNAELGLKKTMRDMRRLLQNPYYRGVNVNCRAQWSMVFGRKPREGNDVKMTYHAQVLCDEETWLRVKARLAREKNVGQHREQRARYALSGLLWCARCNRRLGPHQKRPGEVNYYCHVCGARRSETKFITIIDTHLSRITLSPEVLQGTLMARAAEQRRAVEQQLANAEHELGKVTRRRAGYQRMRADGDIETEDYLARMRETDQERTTWQAECDRLVRQLDERMDLPADVQLLLSFVGQHRTVAECVRREDIDTARGFFERSIREIRFDPDAETVTVQWAPLWAHLMAQAVSVWLCPAGRHVLPTPRDPEALQHRSLVAFMRPTPPTAEDVERARAEAYGEENT